MEGVFARYLETALKFVPGAFPERFPVNLPEADHKGGQWMRLVSRELLSGPHNRNVDRLYPLQNR